MSNKQSFCIANWKMNKSLDESNQFLNKLTSKDLTISNSKLIICPSFISLSPISLSNSSNLIEFGSQNVSSEEEGSLTGEISVSMLENINCNWSIIGHSERRQSFFETDDLIAKKMKLVLESNLNPILCIGETLEERNNNLTEEILNNQLETAFSKVNTNSLFKKNILIAYEPVWAIGTGVSADIETINNNIAIIKNIVNNYIINNCNIYLLYGGSVNERNAAEIFNIKYLNGFLIGTSSLDVNSFYNIYKQI